MHQTYPVSVIYIDQVAHMLSLSSTLDKNGSLSPVLNWVAIPIREQAPSLGVILHLDLFWDALMVSVAQNAFVNQKKKGGGLIPTKLN